MRIWIVQGGEYAEGTDILWDGGTALVFADDKYSDAFLAFSRHAGARCGTDAEITFPSGHDTMARAHVVARSRNGVDTVELRPYDVIGS